MIIEINPKDAAALVRIAFAESTAIRLQNNDPNRVYLSDRMNKIKSPWSFSPCQRIKNAEILEMSGS